MKTLGKFTLALVASSLLPLAFAKAGGPPNPKQPSQEEADSTVVGPLDKKTTPAPAPTPSYSKAPMAITDTPPLAPVAPDPVETPPVPPLSAGLIPIAPAKTTPCVQLFGDFLYLRSRGADTIYGQPRDGSTALSAPLGPQGTLQPDYAPGFRVGADYFLSNVSKLETSFTWWAAQSSSFLQAPGNPVGAIVQPTLTLPTIANAAATGQSAIGNLGLELRNFDLVYLHQFWGVPSNYCLSWLAGGRYAYLRQDLHADYAILGTTSVDSGIHFDGVGPQIGLDGQLYLDHGVRLFCRTSASFVAGYFGSTYNQFNTFAGNQGNITYKNDRIVPILDLDLGVGWTSPSGCISIMGGYHLEAWFDTVNTPDFVNAVQANNFSNNSNNLKSTMTFDGLMFRVAFRF